MNLKIFSDDQLLNATAVVVDSERRITANAIKHFFEINRRRLYLKAGYGSLFEMLRTHYKYCEPTAQLRKNAVCLMQDVPAVMEKIESGEMPVTVAANIQSFLYAEKRLSKAYSPEEKLELVETCTGKSVRDVQKEFARRNPEIEKRESVRQVTEDRVRVSHSISNELEEKLKRIKSIWSHVDPNMSREDVLNRMAEITLDKIDPLRKAKRAEKRKSESPSKTSTETTKISDAQSNGDSQAEAPHVEFRAPEVKDTRHIPADETHKVYLNNEDCGCDFVSSIAEKRCGSKFQLQRDHVQPFSHGGPNTSGNLRLFCGSHNRYAWRTRSTTLVRQGRCSFG